MKISILDQSPVRKGDTAQTALRETIELALYAERLGYSRFWVSEHHNTGALAGSAPEVLLAAIGAATRSIRIGSGGIMVPHYSSYKVAEVFSVLATLYPGRVDLGVGRAPGTDMVSARALAADGIPRFEQFPQQVQELIAMLAQDLPPAGASPKPRITPRPPYPPPIWMLGSSPDSALLAAQLGLPYNFALFINPEMDGRIFQYYRQRFSPSPAQPSPHTCLTVNVICADTEAQAQRLALSRDLAFLRYVTHQPDVGVPPIEEAESYPFSDDERAFLQQRGQRSAIGDPQQVRSQLLALAEEFGADELMTVTIVYEFAARKRSYELLAEAMGLSKGYP